MATKQLAVFDATTGTVLAPDNLIAVLATEKQLDKASNSDSDFALAAANGSRISYQLLRLIASGKRPTADEVQMLADIFGWDVEYDNDGQMVIYTGTKARR